jgi:hypothetical protein
MKSKVYYGEYSLKHWIDLILKKNLRLPKYQRHFVWDEQKTLKLVESLGNGQFVPPVIIGAFKDENGYHNYILDGQQRLTSILLAYLGYFPDKSKFTEETDDKLADDNDFNDDDTGKGEVIEWTFKELLEKGDNTTDTKTTVTNRIVGSGKYNVFDPKIKDVKAFLEDTYLGFSFIIPNTEDKNGQQRYYSTVFRNINIMGVKLMGQESRESLYYLNQDLYDLFSPPFAKAIRISKRFTSTPVHMDFVRYMSLLSQYYRNGGEGKVGMHYSGKLMESYYEEYIYNVVNDTRNENFPDFKGLFPDKSYQGQIKILEKAIDDLGLKQVELLSIIDMDVYFFGIIYHVFLKKKELDLGRKDALLDELKRKVSEFKRVERGSLLPNYHLKNPAALKYLRMRMKASIEIYRKYLKV